MEKDASVLRKRLDKLIKMVAEAEAHLAVSTKELQDFFGTVDLKQVRTKVAAMQRAAEVAEQEYNKAHAAFTKKWEALINEEFDK